MPITPQTVRDLSLSGQFNSYTDPQIQSFIDRAADYMNAEAWGARYDRGLSLLAAHLLSVEIQAGASGAGVVTGEVTSMRLGPASRTYATTPSSGSGVWSPLRLHSTRFGQQFQGLLQLLPTTPLVAFDNVTTNPDFPGGGWET